MLTRSLLRSLRPLRLVRCLSTNEQTFRENDIVLLRPVGGKGPEDHNKAFLSGPLRPGGQVETHMGVIKHSDIISKQVRHHAISSKGKAFRITWPTTEEYVTRVRRLVTPIYPQDAATIVSMLDLHVDPPPHPSSAEPRLPLLEILEAGTGHGSLTIALAKAVHAANPRPAPPSTSSAPISTPIIRADLRNAIIHTVDISPTHSEHAKRVIGQFRRGMYLPHIDFHTGTLDHFIESQFLLRSLQSSDVTKTARDPFLQVIILDLPSPEDYLQICEEALHADGILGIFCPHITQVATVVRKIRDGRHWLVMIQVVEFINNGGVRDWDVRLAKVRNPRLSEKEERLEMEEAASATPQGGYERWEMVCRPRPGSMVVGGGFFAMFKKARKKAETLNHEDRSERREAQEEKFSDSHGGVVAWLGKAFGAK